MLGSVCSPPLCFKCAFVQRAELRPTCTQVTEQVPHRPEVCFLLGGLGVKPLARVPANLVLPTFSKTEFPGSLSRPWRDIFLKR